MGARKAAIRRLAPDDTKPDEVSAAEEFVAWSGGHRPLEAALGAAPGAVPSLREIALQKGLDDLVTALGRSAPPADLPGDTAQVRRTAFARQLRTGLFQREPTAVLQRMVQDDEISIGGAAEQAGVVRVLGNLGAGFDLRRDSLTSALRAPEALDGVPEDQRKGVIEGLKTLQRVQAFSPTPEAVAAVIGTGNRSAMAVAMTPREQFLRLVKGQLDPATAVGTHETAMRVQIRNEDALAAMRQQITGSGIQLADGALSQRERLDRVQRAADATGATLDVQGLFGDLDFCECDDCLSVYSPAAYFVELLQYLRNNNLDLGKPAVPGIAGTPLEKLLRRRPDLGCLELTCANTNVVLPYVDLVNEIMESFVVHLDDYAENTDDPKQVTLETFNVRTETSGELQAQPHHVNQEAYCILKSAVFPIGLPYHQPIDRMRIWLRAMKTTRFDVLDRFRSGPPDSDTKNLDPDDLPQIRELWAALRQRAADAEFLGLTQEQYVILTGEAFPPRAYLELCTGNTISPRHYRRRIGVRPVHEYYGYISADDMLDADETRHLGLTFVKDQLLPRTGLAYAELVEILRTRFVNPVMPSGPALRLTMAIQASYRFLQTLVDTTTTDPKRRFAKVIDFLVSQQGVVPGLWRRLSQDGPCGPTAPEEGLTRAELTAWVHCWFDRLGQLIVLDSGERPRLPITGDLYGPFDFEGWGKLGHLDHAGSITDLDGAPTGQVDPDGKAVLNSGRVLSNIQILSPEGFVIGEIDGNGFLIRPSSPRQEAPGETGPGSRIRWLPPADSCDLDPVRLIHLDGSAVTKAEYGRIQCFARLWRALGWTVPETDQVLAGLGADGGQAKDDPDAPDHASQAMAWDAEEDCGCSTGPCGQPGRGCPPVARPASISADFLHELTFVHQIMDRTGLELERVLAFWDDIGTAGDHSLYARVFLRHDVLGTDDVFRPDANGQVLVGAGPLTDHLAGIQAALGMAAQDVAVLSTELGLPDELTVTTLSALFRYAVLGRRLRLKTPDLVRLRAVFGDPFVDAGTTWAFLEDWQRAEDAGLSLRQLDFALTGHDDVRRPLAPSKVAVLRLAKTLYDGLTAIDQQHADLGDDDAVLATVERLRTECSLLFDDPVVNHIVGLLQGSWPWITNAPAGLAIQVPQALAGRVTYTSPAAQPGQPAPPATLSVTGILDDNDRALVQALSALPAWHAALDRLAAQPKRFFEATIAPLVADPAAQRQLAGVLLAGDVWLVPGAGEPASAEPSSAAGKRLAFLQALLPELRSRLAHKLVVDTVSSAAGLDGPVTDLLLSSILSTDGRSAMAALLSLRTTGSAEPGFSGYLIVPATDDYVFVASGFDAEPAALSIDGAAMPLDRQQQDPNNVWQSGPVPLRSGTLIRFNSHAIPLASLAWRTTGHPTAAIPASALLADHMTAGVGEVLVKLWRTAVLMNAHQLDAEETSWLDLHQPDFGGWDFDAPGLAGWRRLAAYTRLRSTISSNGAAMVALFRWACETAPDPAQLADRIVTATGWDPAQISELLAPDGFDVPDPEPFRNEIMLTRMARALEVVDACRAEVPQLFAWAAPGSRFWPAHALVSEIEAAYRGRFPQEDWEKAVEPLYDELRAHQRRALVDYLVARPELREWGVLDADGLFEFFLIDVEMGTCRDTSRIKQAISSVQTFVQRCLLGQEADHGVDATVLDRRRWGWMQKYRVWEANRKVFVNPESYLRAELRDDTSEIFDALQAQLLQKDINQNTIEAALRAYVDGLDGVARLEPAGLYVDNAMVYLFARTQAAPHLFYYRVFDTQNIRWYPWQRVPVDVPSYDVIREQAKVQTNVNGCYLVPVVFQGRLLIFFPQFNRKTDPPAAASGSDSFNDVGGNPVFDTQSLLSWEIKLNYSEFRDGKWSPKRLSTSALYSYKGAVLPDIGSYIFVPRITSDSVLIDVYDHDYDHAGKVGRFEFSGHHVDARGDAADWTIPDPPLTFHWDSSDALRSLQAPETGGPLYADRPYARRNLRSVVLSPARGADNHLDDADVPPLLGTLNTRGIEGLFQYYLDAAPLPERYGPYQQNNVTLFHELRSPTSLYTWELGFHALMLLAQRLLSARQFDDALRVMHGIVNPTAKDTAQDPVWRFLPLRLTEIDRDAQDLFLRLQPNTPDKDISEWRDNPFNPHVVARGRISAYKRWAAMQYVRIWIEYGDYYFRQNTLETIPMAIQCYVMASHLYGPAGQEIPKRGKTEPATYRSLLDRWDAFSNALVDLELAFPFMNQPDLPDLTELPDGETITEPQPANLFGSASSLYFCIPANPEIQALRATIDDRLAKIRACQDINGVYSPLPLFEAPLDPNLLVAAAAAGLSISSVLNDLDTPIPDYRFVYLMQKALDACSELKSLSAAFLSAKEKGDAEGLQHLRAVHEHTINGLVMEVRTRQLEEATAARDTLAASRTAAVYRLTHQLKLLGEDLSKLPSEITDYAELPDLIEAPVDVGGLKVNALEKQELDKAAEARDRQTAIGHIEALASVFHAIPTLGAHATPIGVGAALTWGGSNLGNLTQAIARELQVAANGTSFESTNAGRKAALQRQLQERVQQANIAGHEITNIDKQMVAQNIRIDIASKEITNQQAAIDNSQAVLDFLESKYSGPALYTWMEGQLSNLHYQAYTLAYELAKKAEKLFRFERAYTGPSFIQFGYWDPARDGLLAGEKLWQGLKQLESAYQNSRGHDFEITKSISVRQLDPAALMTLRETGACEFSLPEVLFDMDYPGHYQRRIKTVGLSMPCTIGPHTGLNATVRLLKHQYRATPEARNAGNYPQSTDEDDPRFTTTNIPLTAAAFSSADSENGSFELNLNSERFLFGEGAGVISSWRLELPRTFRQFDYRSITDVTMRLRYTSRDGGDALRTAAEGALLDWIKDVEDLSQTEGLFTAFDVINEFADAWYAGMHPPAAVTERVVELPDITRTLPFFTQGQDPEKVMASDIYLFVQGDLSADQITAVQGGVDVSFTNGAPAGDDLAVFAAHDVGAPVTSLKLTIADLTASISQFWVVERFTLL
ncbi:neuraminidase-like domain-containing protein [Streptomyces sp. NPDC004237]|uniref:Tc toxin subunit A-related protein n=1 Tax=Streptomyces sp. NPDC004237 TaxID=3154455 RepID=UPI0033A21581